MSSGKVMEAQVASRIKERFEQVLKEQGPSQDVYLTYAALLAEEGLVVESLEVLFLSVKLFSTNTEKLVPVVSKFVDHLRIYWRENCSLVSEASGRNVFSCPSCRGVLHDPTTLPCGHTYCRGCLLKEPQRTCRVCQCKLKDMNVASMKTNVVVCGLVERWWSREVEGVRLRTTANHFVRDQRLLDAVDLYTQAIQYAPRDHLLLSNRSHVLHTLGRAEDALKDAEAAIRCRPDWAKGYFRRAAAQTSMGRYEDALASLLQCAVVEETPSLASIKDEIAKSLHRLLVRLIGRGSSRYHHHHHLHHHHHHHHHNSCPSPHEPLFPPLLNSDEDDSGEDSEDGVTQRGTNITLHPGFIEVPALRKVVDKFNKEMERSKKCSDSYMRSADPSNVDKNDFECTLCFRYFHEPVTTPCGHSFCRSCLDRCLDHSTNCPLCKTCIRMYLAERRSAVTEFLEMAMKAVMPSEHVERQQQHEQELDELAAAGKDPHHEIPIFVATLAIPTVSCPLHVFEPRYRLMIRRCMESGTREFGMCMPQEDVENGYANYGTMLEIRDVEYTQDGRSIVNTVGSRRFKVVSKNARDGYNTASVEFLQDKHVGAGRLGELRRLHDSVHKLASQWFESIEAMTKRRILGHYGAMPGVEGEYWTTANGPAWMWWVVAILPLDHRIQLSILCETSLQRRLEVLNRIVRCVLMQQRARQGVGATQ